MTNTISTGTQAGAAQTRLTIAYHVNPADAGTNVGSLSRLPEDVHVDRYIDAVSATITNTPALNEFFTVGCDGHVQRHVHSARHTVERHTVEDLDHLHAEVTRRTDTPIDPGTWPLIRTAIYTVGDSRYFYLGGSHVAIDGFGAYLVMKDIADAYRCEDLATWRPDPSLSPADLSKVDLNETSAEKWFRTTLPSGPLSIPEWESSRGGDGVLSGSVTHTDVPDELIRRVERTRNALGVSSFSVFLAAELLLLRCVSGSTTPVVSVPLSCRRASADHAQTRGAVVNALPLAVDLSLHATAGELIGAVHRRMSELTAFEHLDPSKLREMLTGSTEVIPSASFTYYPAPFVVPLDSATPVTPVWFERKHLQYPLALVLARSPQGTILRTEQADGLADIDVPSLYLTILEQITTLPGIGVAALEWQPAGSDRAAHLPPIASFPSTQSSIPSRWKQQVADHPDAVAVKAGGSSWSYRELDAVARRIASAVEHDIEATLVGVAIPPSAELVATLLGILMSGKAYVPIDVAAPVNRVESIVDTCSGLPLVTVGECPWDIPDLAPIEYQQLIADKGTTQDVRPDGDSLAYVIFTSGSTGRPKGVPIHHRNVTRLIDSVCTVSELDAQTWTLFHSYAFDFSVWEIFGCLLTGGQLVIPDDAVRADPTRFVDFVVEEGIEVLNQTPSAFGLFMAGASDAQLRASAIRTLIFGGEALYFDQLRRFRNLRGDATDVINMYGITETTVHTTYHHVVDADVVEPRSIIGAPLPDTGVMIVDTDGRVLPVGVLGELAVYGPGVTGGYLNRPDLTAERITTVAGHPNTYLSGDLGYVTSDGGIVYVGRGDNQLQLRGHRVELGEVEWALRQHPKVSDAAVVPRGSGIDTQLTAFVVPSSEHEGRFELRPSDLADCLPCYMMPAEITPLAELPVTLNGKIDRARLAATAALPDASPVMDGDLQSCVRTAWSKVLGHSEFGDFDRFLDVGGDSQRAVALVHLLRVALNLPDLAVVDIFEFTTIDQLVRFLEDELQLFVR